ncbi:hypothetical protein V8Z80_13050 [Orrella sp. JC864]|uniref:hypothetical protein n=1 Tax=Orrella sp. JC864 TaxID=3120298 RepID=UPI003007F5CF
MHIEAGRPGPAPATAVSSETAFVLDAHEARMLAEVGMLAAGAADAARAERIFGALRRLRPGRAYPWLGLALARANSGQADQAAQLLEGARLDDAQEAAILQAWRGLVLQLAGRRDESRKVLAAAAAMHGEGAELARRLLGGDPASPARQAADT